MSALVKAIKRLEYANYLIKKKAIGDLETFAKKMKLSERSIRDLISEMREMGASIKYDRARKTYYYSEDGEFYISKFLKYGQIIERESISKIGKPEDLCFSEKAIFIPCEDT